MRSKKRILGAAVLVSVVLFCYTIYWSNLKNTPGDLSCDLVFVRRLNGTCALPAFKVYPPSIFKEVQLCKSKVFDCLLFNRTDKVVLKNSHCQYRIISRKDDFNLLYSSWYKTDFAVKWKDDNEVLEVRCPDTIVHDEYCIYRKISRNDNIVYGRTVNSVPKHDLNIILVGLDSMSRRLFANQLPKSINFFTKKMKGVQFLGHSIVGDGTTAAFLSMLAGVFEEDVHETRRGFHGATTLDDLPFIWKNFHDSGYLTSYDETEPGTGTFQLRLLGFNKPPVHYYGRPFQLVTTAGLSARHYQTLCLGNQSRFSEGLAYLYQFFNAYPTERKFSIYFDSLLTHSEKPRAEPFDEELLSFLKKLSSTDHANSTMVILFSDHGPRYGHSRQTILGKYEERSPFLAIALPKSFREANPHIENNMLTNANFTLTTPFDLHATFLDILGINNTSLMKKLKLKKRGLSLFSKLPASRSCSDLDIAPHWCPCANGQPVEPKSDLVVKAMKIFLKTVNNEWLRPAADMCYSLVEATASAAEILRPGDKMLTFTNTIDGHGRVPSFTKDNSPSKYFLAVTFKTEPGGGTWEATFSVSPGGHVSVSRSQVSRTNAYGPAADCISNSYPHLRQFCFCDFTHVKL